MHEAEVCELAIEEVEAVPGAASSEAQRVPPTDWPESDKVPPP